MSGTGRYRIERRVGRGGTAEVFEASIVGQGGFARKVAIKRLRPELARDPTMVKEFEAEARLMSRLHHANVVGVLDFGTMEGLPFQVLEFVDGVDLLALEARAKEARIPMKPELWVAIACEVAHGLDYVHGAVDGAGRPLGLVHRDMTPTNVLVAWTGDVKVADFGIALSLEEREATRVGVVKGKLEYIPPEVLRGESSDPRSDVFALGCMLHRVLTGQDLIPDEATRRRLAANEPAPLRGAIPAELGRVILRATLPDRERRCPSAAAFADDCARYLSSQGVLDGRVVLREAMAKLRPPPATAPSPIAAWALVPELPSQDSAGVATVPPIDDDPSETRSEAPSPRAALHEPQTVIMMPDAVNRLLGAPRRPSEPTLSHLATQDELPTTLLMPLATAPGPDDSATGSASASGPAASTDQSAPVTAFDYALLDPIAEGGFASVFRARHNPSGAIVALKTLREDRVEHKAAPARFEREAEALKRLDSPYLVRVRDAGRMPDGRPFLAMDLLEGRTLGDEILLMKGPLLSARTRRLSRDIALGLAALHQADIVHRDLGAKNVMVIEVAGRERAVLIDLGHMRWIDERPHTPLTAPGLMLGNARWMAPEQVFSPSAVGPAADLYSLGLLMLAMTTGRPPFTGSPATVLRAQLEVTPEIPPGPFASLIKRLIDKDPARRPRTASDVANELSDLQLSRAPETTVDELRRSLAPPAADSAPKTEPRVDPSLPVRASGPPLSPRSPTEQGPNVVESRAALAVALTGLALLAGLLWWLFRTSSL